MFLFIVVSLITWFNLVNEPFMKRLTDSILSGITLIMAMIPEKFPVVLTVFLSMGVWRLAKKKSLVRKLSNIETLGAVSVLCVDKTGTITTNEMEIQEVWMTEEKAEFLKIMSLACEKITYDPMEKAMLKYAQENGINYKNLLANDLVDEYTFTDDLKMMGHIWKINDELIVAAKGSPEKIIELCKLDKTNKKKINQEIKRLSSKSLRVIAIASTTLGKAPKIPKKLTDLKLNLLGLVDLVDSPRVNVKKDIATCYKAGIRVIMITGDNGITASSIAKEIGLKEEGLITGEELDKMSDKELKEALKKTTIFARVIPNHKMRIAKALKENGEIVAMTGDGVNDASALKYADIGIAMGKRGSQVSQEATDLILLDDNFSTIVNTIHDGRRIYDNIKKSIGYILTIHIPIALSTVLAPIMEIKPENLMLLPIHVALLELLIDPTCSIVFERQPAEENIMNKPPRNIHEPLLTTNLLLKSISQGLIIFSFLLDLLLNS